MIPYRTMKSTVSTRPFHATWLSAVFAFFITGGISRGEGPVVPGPHGKHPLSEEQSGKLLISELRCAACHDGLDASRMKEAPVLSGAGSRLTPDFIKNFVADPSSVHHGTTMPGMLGGLSAEIRDEVAADISAYLSSLKGTPPPMVEADADPYDGKEIFANIGCVACHSPRDEAGREVIKDGVISLAHLPGKYQPGALAEFLHMPLKVRPSGRMPDMKLTKTEASALAAYLAKLTDAAPETIPATDSIAAGRKAFQTHACTACHQPEEEKLPIPAGAPPLGKLDLSAGCLSENPGSAPDFKLSAAQKAAIRKALAQPLKKEPPAEQIKLHLTQLNCIACHERDDYGGVSPKLDGYFHSTEEALGNESRIPPQLTLTGAKLRPEWMKKVLYDGESIRPYMKTRMPQFGETALGSLADLFAEVDHLPPFEIAPPGKEDGPEMRDGALELLGDKGLNCIACHNYNGKQSPGMKGLDLMTSYQRLQPAWFHSYMINPAAFRPGIIMPSYWPAGKATQTEILGGDTDRQLRALWDNFSLGRSARDPSGLRAEPSELKVTDTARTYRGRSNVAGYRGIAVGFPGGMNYAFNAQNGALTAIWQGGFVRVGWQGQGSGNFDPPGKHVQLSQDVAFIQAAVPPAIWPPSPVTSKEQPVNPDPLYPKNHGYAFIGYSLDIETFVPTFAYRCGDVLITDKTLSDGKTLKRSFSFTAPDAQTVWLRALTGSVVAESETVFKTADLKLTIPPGKTILRPASESGQELLIELALPKGKSTTLIEYELLR